MSQPILTFNVTLLKQNSGFHQCVYLGIGDFPELSYGESKGLQRKTKNNYWRFGMNISTLVDNPAATDVQITENALIVTLLDGRVVSIPITWYPRLSYALPEHRDIFEFIGGGHGIHWPELDEDISIENLLLGHPSGECAKSFKLWTKWYQQKLPVQKDYPVKAVSTVAATT